MKTKHIILYFSTVLVLLILGGCGNPTEESAGKEEVTETEIAGKSEEVSEDIEIIETETEEATTTPDVYWDNINVYFKNVDDAMAYYSNGSATSKATREFISSLNAAHDTLENLNVPDHPSYQEYHQQLVDSLPRYIASFENLLLYIPESNNDYVNNPQPYDDAVRYVELESMVYEQAIDKLNEMRQTLQVGL